MRGHDDAPPELPAGSLDRWLIGEDDPEGGTEPGGIPPHCSRCGKVAPEGGTYHSYTGVGGRADAGYCERCAREVMR